jgi:hypothetical protein
MLPPDAPPLKVVAVPDIAINEVPALNVRVAFPFVKSTGLVPLNVTVELPKLIVRVLTVLDDRDVAVTL